MAWREVHAVPPDPLLVHVARSQALILEAAVAAGAGRAALDAGVEPAGVDALGAAAVLGCGRGHELPLDQLARALGRIDLVDHDHAALAALRARLGPLPTIGPSAYRFHAVELTGLAAPLAAAARTIVAAATDPTAALAPLAGLLDGADPRWWHPPDRLRYHLVVCSGILTQVHVGVRAAIEAAVRDRFGDDAGALIATPAWGATLLALARRLEDGFVRHLDRLARPGGVIYLADTVHVSWLVAVDADAVATGGAWLATRTARLADYLDADATVLAEEAWPWLRLGAEGPYVGRRYGVQALIYRTASEAAA